MTTSTQKSQGAAEERTDFDPVCGAVVPCASATAEATFDEQHFYFCSHDCKNRFEREPSRYLVSCVELA